MILEIENHRVSGGTPARPIEFVTMQLMPLADGSIAIAMKSTTFDEKELELVDQDIVDGRIASLDQLFGIIRSHVRIVPNPAGWPVESRQ